MVTLVQFASNYDNTTFQNQLTVQLPNAPTPGNQLLFVVVIPNQSGFIAPPDSTTLLSQNQTLQGSIFLYKQNVQFGASSTFVFTTYATPTWTGVAEFSGASSLASDYQVAFQSVAESVTWTSSPLTPNSLNAQNFLFFVPNDVSAVVSSAPSGYNQITTNSGVYNGTIFSYISQNGTTSTSEIVAPQVSFASTNGETGTQLSILVPEPSVVPANGGNTYVTSASGFLIPPVGQGVTFTVADGSGFPNWSWIFVSDGVNAITGQIDAGGGTNTLTLGVSSISMGIAGSTMAYLAGVSYSGPMGQTGSQGPTGPQGLPAPLAITTMAYTAPASGNASNVYVTSNAAYPALSFVYITNGSTIGYYGQVQTTGTLPGSGAYINVLNLGFAIGNSLTTVPLSSTVTFSGIQGFEGFTGAQGPQGQIGPTGAQGVTGYGATTTTSILAVPPVGTNFPVPVVSVAAFPLGTWILVSDGNYGFIGQVTNQNFASSLLGVRVNSFISGMVGSQIQVGAVVTFQGPPGTAGPTSVQYGYIGTVLMRDATFSSQFYTGTAGIASYATLGVLTYPLPTTIAVNWRVVVTLAGCVTTNTPVSGNAYLGIGSTAQTYLQTISQGTFSSVQTNYAAGPSIPAPSCVADGIFTVSTPVALSNSTGGPITYIGTFGSGSQLAFSVLATAEQTLTSFTASGILTMTAYPIYQP